MFDSEAKYISMCSQDTCNKVTKTNWKRDGQSYQENADHKKSETDSIIREAEFEVKAVNMWQKL